jgi:hypothetical protein
MENEYYDETGKFFTDEEREGRIKREYVKLKKIIKSLTPEKKVLVDNLIKNIAFCIVELEELSELIKRDGFFETYRNGENQYGLKKSIAQDIMLQTGKLYSTYLGRLEIYLPDETDDGDDFNKFKKKQKERLAEYENG